VKFTTKNPLDFSVTLWGLPVIRQLHLGNSANGLLGPSITLTVAGQEPGENFLPDSLLAPLEWLWQGIPFPQVSHFANPVPGTKSRDLGTDSVGA
jgi:hypothetical protein